MQQEILVLTIQQAENNVYLKIIESKTKEIQTDSLRPIDFSRLRLSVELFMTYFNEMFCLFIFIHYLNKYDSFTINCLINYSSSYIIKLLADKKF